MSINVEDSEDSWRDIGKAEEEIAELLRDFADWIYRQIEKEYEWRMSDENVDESIRVNDYEFSDVGEIC